MTEEKEGPVHYQVSVTGRQAAAFFLVLLASLGLSFFFGMKTGAAATKGPDRVSALAAQSDIPVPTANADEAGGPPTPAPTEAPIGFEPAAREPAREAAAKPEPPAREEPVPVVKELAPPPTEPARDVPKAAPAPKEDGPFWVQIVVTSNAAKADDLAKKLKADGFRPVVSPLTGKKGLSFRVRVGPYPDRAKADAAAAKVQKVEKLASRPIVVPGK